MITKELKYFWFRTGHNLHFTNLDACNFSWHIHYMDDYFNNKCCFHTTTMLTYNISFKFDCINQYWNYSCLLCVNSKSTIIWSHTLLLEFSQWQQRMPHFIVDSTSFCCWFFNYTDYNILVGLLTNAKTWIWLNIMHRMFV